MPPPAFLCSFITLSYDGVQTQVAFLTVTRLDALYRWLPLLLDIGYPHFGPSSLWASLTALSLAANQRRLANWKDQPQWQRSSSTGQGHGRGNSKSEPRAA